MKGSARGIWLVVGVFAVGTLALVGLFMAPRGKPPSTMPTTSATSGPATSRSALDH